MKLANINGAAWAIDAAGGFDIASASEGAFSRSIDDLVAVLPELRTWVAQRAPEGDPSMSESSILANLNLVGPVITRPSQIFAIGLNYADHAGETGYEVPTEPMVFTKWSSSLTGAAATVAVVADTVDWEVELVVVIAKTARDIAVSDAMDHVAGYCIGQDISERRLQMVSNPAQFSLAKSLENFSPIGPWLTTLDELSDPHDLAISCTVDDELLQSSRTSNMIFDVPSLIAYLSARVELRAGDLIFTGTPDGVGVGRRPRRFIEPGWTITSTIEGLGHLRNEFR